MNKIRISNDWWITLTMGVVLLIMIRLVFLIDKVYKLDKLISSLRNYENEKTRLTKRYDETNMRINEIHRIINDNNTRL